jgi:aminocarboxymuconate-semialdehyde decarboxylase
LSEPPLRTQAGERRIVAMIDFHTHWIPSGLPDLAARSDNSRWPVFDQPTGRLMISGEAVRALPASGWDVQVRLDAMDAAGVARHVLSPVPPLLCAWVREGTASALLSLQ